MISSLSDVFMRPAWEVENAYCHMLADALVKQGLIVHELAPGVRSFPSRPGIAFFHWPNEMFFVSSWRSGLSVFVLLAKIAYTKLFFGMRVVWLAHNVVPHDRRGWRFFPARKVFLALLDGVIFLSETSRQTVISAYPRLYNTPQLVVPHGVYLARSQPAALPSPVYDRPVQLVFAGRLKRYKAPDLLAKSAVALTDDTIHLKILGACDDIDLLNELTEIARSGTNVSIKPGFLDEEELEAALDNADAVVIPYRDILNSGSAIHALSRFRPFIAPRLGSLVELQNLVGHDWVWLYEGDLNPKTLAIALRWVRETKRLSGPRLDTFQWDEIGHRVARFLKTI